MLIRFRVSNFKSIRDEQEFSMVAGDFAGPTEPLRHVDGLDMDLLTVAAIYGPNASGKSTVIDALKFVSDAVERSHRSWEPDGPTPHQPFLLSSASSSEPSLFEVEFLLGGIRHRYGFVLNSERVLEEWLYVYPNGRKQMWFLRDAAADEPFRFGKHLPGENRTTRSITRANSLFLSAAAQNNHKKLLPIYQSITDRILFSVPQDRALRFELVYGIRDILETPAFRIDVLNLLSFADLGIVGLEFDRTLKHVPWGNGALFSAEVVLGRLPSPFKLRHRAAGVENGVAIPLDVESKGTQALLSLAVSVVAVLRAGGIMCVDELEASLHPAIAREIVRMFHDPRTNPHGSQLIFNTHDTNLLDSQVEGARLRRDQIWFTEKDDAGATHLYPLTDFKPRTDENLERGYLQGRYGAIPVVGSLSFLQGAASSDGKASE